MTTSMNGGTLAKGMEWLGPLFGEAWAEQPLDLFSERIKGLAATGLLNPRGLTSGETQALAAAVMAYVVANARYPRRRASLGAFVAERRAMALYVGART